MKPDDFFVGVLDLFSVLLPGVVVVTGAHLALAAGALPGGTSDDVRWLQQQLALTVGSPTWWIAASVASYLAGHLVFLLAASLDSAVFDPLRVAWVPDYGDRAYAEARSAQERALGEVTRASNVYQWARLSLQLDAPTAYAEVVRHEADSKFFRSFVVVLYGAMGAVLLAGRGAGRPALVGAAAALGLVVVLLAAQRLWDDRRLREIARAEEAGDRAGAHALRATHQIRRRARARALTKAVAALLVGATLLAWAGGRSSVAVLMPLLALSTWRYWERRWKGMTIAYRAAAILAARAAKAGQGR